MCVVDVGYRRVDAVGLREGSDTSRQGVIGAPAYADGGQHVEQQAPG